MIPTVCPTVTAIDAHEYREQIERVAGFASRIHLDFMDGEFAPIQSLPVESAWWPKNISVDIHLMHMRPQEYLSKVVNLHPSLLIVHAEAEGHFVGIAEVLHKAGIKAGVALLPDTDLEVIIPSLKYLDHVLIFSGNLGHFGGTADMQLLGKVRQIKSMKKNIEIGWDGGINEENVGKIVSAGVSVLNVGGYIQRAKNPAGAYATLRTMAGKQK